MEDERRKDGITMKAQTQRALNNNEQQGGNDDKPRMILLITRLRTVCVCILYFGSKINCRCWLQLKMKKRRLRYYVMACSGCRKLKIDDI